MKENLLTIGEISKAKGITAKALRFYEKIGLLKPSYIDPTTKYRYYSMDQFIYIDIIKASRIMDISPNDIKVILEKKDTDMLLDFLEQQKVLATQKILDMKRTISIMEAFNNYIRTSGLSISNQDIYFKQLPQRNIVIKKLGNQVVEKMIHMEFANFCKLLKDNKLINTFECGLFCTPDENNQYKPTHVFGTVVTDDESNTSILSSIQASRFLCICYNKHNAQERLFKLKQYIEQNSLEPKIYLQVFLLDNLFESSSRYIEMQVLV